VYDVIVGVNLLREGIDLPEVTLVAILDADKEGYLRSKGSLIQVIGRAARHVEGTVIMYADRVTDSMQHAIDETERRRAIQVAWNAEHGIEPQSVVKAIRDIGIRLRSAAAEGEQREQTVFRAKDMSRDELVRLVKDLETQMKQAARDLDFERAAMLRDEIVELRGLLVLEQASPEVRTLERMAGSTDAAVRTKRVIKGRRGRR
jgi:excinuclease ABC subunit B